MIGADYKLPVTIPTLISFNRLDVSPAFRLLPSLVTEIVLFLQLENGRSQDHQIVVVGMKTSKRGESRTVVHASHESLPPLVVLVRPENRRQGRIWACSYYIRKTRGRDLNEFRIVGSGGKPS